MISMIRDIMRTLNNVQAKKTGIPKTNGVTRLNTVAPRKTPKTGSNAKKTLKFLSPFWWIRERCFGALTHKKRTHCKCGVNSQRLGKRI